MKFCEKCGEELEDEVRFCQRCGSPADKKKASGNLSNGEKLNMTGSSPLLAKKKGLLHGKRWILFIGAICILIVGVYAIIGQGNLYSPKAILSTSEIKDNITPDLINPNEYGNSNGNLINEGFIAQQGEWIYYNDIFDLYKVSLDGGDKTKLLTSDFEKLDFEKQSSINVVGDWIYYISEKPADGGGEIYKIRTDGSSKTKLSNGFSDTIIVVGDWIFYSKAPDARHQYYKIYKMRTDGSSDTKLTDDNVALINIVGDWLYYCNVSDSYSLYKIQTDGSGNTKLNNDFSDSIVAVGDWIYYSNASEANKLYKIRTDGTGRTKLSDDRSDKINLADDWIYYVNLGDDCKIYKIRIDGTNRCKLTDDDSCDNIYIAGNWIYYKQDGTLNKIKTDGSEKQAVTKSLME